MFKQISLYWRLMRFDKPIGILLLLWPTLWALWIAAKGMPEPKILMVFILGVILMRAAGCVVNDITDRALDRHVNRTQHRPLATQALSVKKAWILAAILGLSALLLVLLLNPLTIALAFIGAALAVIYPWTKRFTHWPQAVLGLAFAWGIPMAFAAVTHSIPAIAWWLFTTTALWIIVYDSQYAMVDREDDVKIGIKSTAILFGENDCLIIGLLQFVVLISLLIMGYYLRLNLNYYLGWACALALAIYQQTLIRQRKPQTCFKAFLNNHWFGLAIFTGLLWGQLP